MKIQVKFDFEQIEISEVGHLPLNFSNFAIFRGVATITRNTYEPIVSKCQVRI